MERLTKKIKEIEKLTYYIEEELYADVINGKIEESKVDVIFDLSKAFGHLDKGNYDDSQVIDYLEMLYIEKKEVYALDNNIHLLVPRLKALFYSLFRRIDVIEMLEVQEEKSKEILKQIKLEE